MEIATVRQLLSTISTERSQWEYDHFVLEKHRSSWPRQVVGQLRELRRILDQQHDLNMSAWTAEKQTLRDELEKQRHQVETWLGQYSDEQIRDAIADYEYAEAEYWPQELGRLAAIDMLSTGRISREITELSLMLPEEGFRTYVRVCGDLASAATMVSQEVAAEAQQLPEEMPR